MAEAVAPGLLEEAAIAGDSDLQVRVRCVGRHDRVSWGSTSVIGRRREMEDALIVVAGFMSRACHQVGGCAAPDSGSSDEIYPVHFFGVYDGHGGSEDTVVKNEAKVSQEDVDLPKASTSVPRNQRRSADNSPLHPHNYQAKLGAKGINGVSGSSEGNHGLAPLTPVRSRIKLTPRGNETPDIVTSVILHQPTATQVFSTKYERKDRAEQEAHHLFQLMVIVCLKITIPREALH